VKDGEVAGGGLRDSQSDVASMKGLRRCDWRPARLRTVGAARQLRTDAAAGLPDLRAPVTGTQAAAARTWLAARGVEGLVRFPIHRFGSDNAPERRAMSGELIPAGAAP
jgi:CRISPR-associated protein Csb3